MQLVSAHTPAIVPVAGANGASTGPVISPDGRFIAYSSTANNLVPGENNLLRSDIFLYDRLTSNTTLVSVNMNGTGGANGHSGQPQVSADGRYVLFVSTATDLVPGATNNWPEIYLRDMAAGTSLVTVATNGGPANGWSYSPFLAANGRYVAFASRASNLVPGDNNSIADIFVRDALVGTTTLVTVGETSASSAMVADMPTLTPDGRYVTFFSPGTGLVPGLPDTTGQVFVRDLQTGVTTWLSSNLPNNSTRYGSLYPLPSDSGRYVSFEYVGPGGQPNFQVFRVDTTTQSSNLVTTNGLHPPGYINSRGLANYGGLFPDSDAFAPRITPDGRYMIYLTYDGNVHVWDSVTTNDVIASLDISSNALVSSQSDTTEISADGRYVTFMSTGTNLVTNAIVPGYHIYQRDLVLSNTVLVDADTNGAGSVDVTGTSTSVSTNGQFVVFSALGGAFVPGYSSQQYDVFLRDVVNGTTTLISQPVPSLISQSASGVSLLSQPSLSTNGRWMAFTSAAEDLVTNDGNGAEDVFVHDLATGSNVLVSVGLNGLAGLGGFSSYPIISGDGRYVVFSSSDTNLTAAGYSLANVFERDLQSGVTTVVSVDHAGALLQGTSASFPAVSQDSRYIAFEVYNFGTWIYWRDTVSNVTSLVTNSAMIIPPSISADGRYVAYADASFYPWVWDSQSRSNIFTTNVAVTGLSLSPTGNKLAYNASGRVGVWSMTGNSSLLNQTSSVPVWSKAVWSADDRFFAFVSATALIAPDTNNASDVYLEDFASNTLTVVSTSATQAGTANAASDWPCLSSDGRWLVFRSWATDFVPGATNPPNLFVYDRLTGTRRLLTIESSPLPSWSSMVAKPSISGDASIVAFQSVKAMLVPGTLDLNRGPDIFSLGQLAPATTDSVGDGIPDAWRAQYFGGNGTTTNSQSCASCDPDGDGMSNLQEYLAGTVPFDAASVLRVQFGATVTSNNVTLTWPAVPNKGYTVLFKTHLTDANWQTAPGAPWVIGNTGYLNVPPSSATTFYRIAVAN